jgi:Glycoside Hydrolase Family 113
MRWARSWILCAAFYYPALWLAVSCVWAFPGLVRSTLLGDHIVELRPSILGLMLWSAPADPAAHSDAGRGFFAFSPSCWILVPLAAAIAFALVRAGLTRRILGSLMVAVLAGAALVLPFSRLRGPSHVSVPLIFSSVVFFALLCVGLYWMSAAWAGSGYWGRLAGLCACAALMPALLWFLFRLLQASRFGNFLWMLAPPAAVAAALVSFRAPGSSAADSQPVNLRAIFSGLATTVLLAAGVTWGGPMVVHAFQLRQQRANEAAVAKLPPIQVNAPYPKIFFQKGVSFSAEFPNPYASPGARQMLRTLHADGVNAVALVPYGGMQLGSPEVHGFGRHSWESDEGLRELSRLAHAVGMKVMLKPGIWIRGGHFGGDIQFASPADREKWFDQYGRFIERYAKLSTQIHVDLFCVGGEFVRMSRYDKEWRKIIANVRRVYPGPVTYAANFGDEFENIKFWDALDIIGLQEYYPLPNDLSTHPLLAKVETVQKRFHKPVLFTEVGFPSAPGGNRRPWKDGKSGEADLQLQARCYQAIFQAFYDKPWFEGMYWWKVGSNGFGGHGDTSLTPWGKPAMQVVRKWYQDGSRENAGLSRAVSEQGGTSAYESR